MKRPLILLLLLTLLSWGCSESTSQYIARARTYMEVPDYRSASVELKRVLQIDRNLAEARWLLGTIYLDLGEVRDAEKELLLAGEMGWTGNDVRPALAKAKLAQGKFQQVLQLEKRNLNPTASARLMSLQALAELSIGRVDRARELVAMARASSPDAAEPTLAQARILAHEWDSRSALNLTETVLERAPDNASAWRLKAQLLLQLEKLPEARAAFDKSISLSHVAFSDRVARALVNLQLEDVDAVRAESAILLELAPGHPSAHYIRGLLQFKDKKYRAAVKSFSAAAPVAGHYPLLLYYASIARLVDGDPNMAAVLAQEYVDLVPEDIAGRKYLAAIHLQRKNAKQALTVIQPALDYDQNDIHALTLKGNALLLNGQSAAAFDAFSRAAALQPDTPTDQLGMGLARQAAPGNEAQAGYMEAIRLNQPDFPLVEILEILQEHRAQEHETAVRKAEFYLLTNPSDLNSYALLAKIYLAAGRPDAANKMLVKALKQDPGNPLASQLMAKIALRKDDTQSAKAHYKTALSEYPNEQMTLMHWAALESHLKNYDQAQLLLEQAIEADPEVLEPRLMLAAVHKQKNRPEKIAGLFAPLTKLQQRSPRVLAISAGTAASTIRKRKIRTSFERSFVENPDHIPSLFVLASLAEERGDQSQFERYLGPLTRLAPDEAQVLRLRSKAASLNEESEEAVALSQRAYLQEPSNRKLLELADRQARAGRKEQGRILMRRWLEMDPYDTAVRVALAANLESSVSVEEAKLQYTAVLEQEPENIIALNNMAWLLRFENPAGALELIRRAASNKRHSPALLDTRAVIEHLNGNHSNALMSIKIAVKLAPDNATIAYHQAMIVAGMGRTKRSIALLEKLISADHGEFPEKEEALKLLASLKPAG